MQTAAAHFAPLDFAALKRCFSMTYWMRLSIVREMTGVTRFLSGCLSIMAAGRDSGRRTTIRYPGGSKSVESHACSMPDSPRLSMSQKPRTWAMSP